MYSEVPAVSPLAPAKPATLGGVASALESLQKEISLLEIAHNWHLDTLRPIFNLREAKSAPSATEDRPKQPGGSELADLIFGAAQQIAFLRSRLSDDTACCDL